MLTVVWGFMGGGKTLFLTILARNTKQKVVSNVNLNFPHEKFDLRTFLEAGYADCMIILDEAYVYLESRDSSLSRNKIGSYILFQSRKKNVDLYFTVQMRSTIDVRFRTLAERWIFAQRTENKDFKYMIYDVKTQNYKTIILRKEKALNYFRFYDTNEIIKPDVDTTEFMNNEEKLEAAETLAKELYIERKDERITMAKTELFLMKRKQSLILAKPVYQMAKDLQNEIE